MKSGKTGYENVPYYTWEVDLLHRSNNMSPRLCVMETIGKLYIPFPLSIPTSHICIHVAGKDTLSLPWFMMEGDESDEIAGDSEDKKKL